MPISSIKPLLPVGFGDVTTLPPVNVFADPITSMGSGNSIVGPDIIQYLGSTAGRGLEAASGLEMGARDGKKDLTSEQILIQNGLDPSLAPQVGQMIDRYGYQATVDMFAAAKGNPLYSTTDLMNLAGSLGPAKATEVLTYGSNPNYNPVDQGVYTMPDFNVKASPTDAALKGLLLGGVTGAVGNWLMNRYGPGPDNTQNSQDFLNWSAEQMRQSLPTLGGVEIAGPTVATAPQPDTTPNQPVTLGTGVTQLPAFNVTTTPVQSFGMDSLFLGGGGMGQGGGNVTNLPAYNVVASGGGGGGQQTQSQGTVLGAMPSAPQTPAYTLPAYDVTASGGSQTQANTGLTLPGGVPSGPATTLPAYNVTVPAEAPTGGQTGGGTTLTPTPSVPQSPVYTLPPYDVTVPQPSTPSAPTAPVNVPPGTIGTVIPPSIGLPGGIPGGSTTNLPTVTPPTMPTYNIPSPTEIAGAINGFTVDPGQATLDFVTKMFSPTVQGAILGAEGTYRPQYTALGLQDLQNMLLGQNGLMGTLGQASAATGSSALNENAANAALRSANVQQALQFAPQLAQAYRQANPELYAQLSAGQQFGGIQNTYGAYQNAFNAPGGATQQLGAEAARLAGSTGRLNPDEIRAIEQATRAGYTARGMEMGNSAIAAEAMARSDAVRQRQQQDIALASQLNQQFMGQAGQMGQYNQQALDAARQYQLGMSSAAQGAAYNPVAQLLSASSQAPQLGLAQQQLNAQLAQQYATPQLVDTSAGINLGLANMANQLSYQQALLGAQAAIQGANTAAGSADRSSNMGLIGNVITAKVILKCIPEGSEVDTPSGPCPIEDLSAGDMVIGYDGSPVRIMQKHEYAEEPNSFRFRRLVFEDHTELACCDEHKVNGIRADDYLPGDVVAGKRILSIESFGHVELSYDLVTIDGGYRMAGVPVNSMVAELASLANSL